MTNIEGTVLLSTKGVNQLTYDIQVLKYLIKPSTTGKLLVSINVVIVWHKTTMFFLEEQASAMHRFTVGCIGNQSKFKWHSAKNRSKTIENHYVLWSDYKNWLIKDIHVSINLRWLPSIPEYVAHICWTYIDPLVYFITSHDKRQCSHTYGEEKNHIERKMLDFRYM